MQSSAGSADRIVPLQEGKFSRTAHRVAIRRAAHQLFDHPRVLDDPLALAIIGNEAAEKLRASEKEGESSIARAFRAFMAARSRYAEDQLAKAIRHGVAQYVVAPASTLSRDGSRRLASPFNSSSAPMNLSTNSGP
jgi:hypothetical protein